MLGYAFDLRPADRLCWVTDLGWVMGPVTILGTLALGGTLVLLEGAADAQPGRIWRVADEVGLTHLGVSPTLVRQLMADGDDPVANRDLDGCGFGDRRAMDPVGVARCTLAWVEAGPPSSTFPAEPRQAASWWQPDPCHQGRCVQRTDARHASGGPRRRRRPVTGVPGELVLTGSWPSMTRGLWRTGAAFCPAITGARQGSGSTATSRSAMPTAAGRSWAGRTT